VPLVLAALPASSGVAVHGTEDSVALRSVLAGKWICPCGIIRSDVHEGEACDDCGKPLLRFHPAEKNQTCSACGFHFSDVEVTTEDTMQEVWARKGFRCNACGENLCVSCSPIEADGGLAFRCGCGGSLAIRV
jgi:ribosomal protein S27E